MKRYIEGVSRDQGTFFPDHLEDWIDDENVVRVIDAFVGALDLPDLGFDDTRTRAKCSTKSSKPIKIKSLTSSKPFTKNRSRKISSRGESRN